MSDDDVIDDSEWFDDYCEQCSELIERQDYAGLIRACQQRLERYPHDPYAVTDVADAYVRAGQFEQALAFLGPYYEADPESYDLQACLLAALAGLGKAWNEFPWRSPPPIVRMSDGVLDECYRFLQPKRKPRSVYGLYQLFIRRGHPLFSEDELLKGLLADGRFVVADQDTYPLVSVRRKSERGSRMRSRPQRATRHDAVHSPHTGRIQSAE
jgi:hypothetical protein